MGGRDGGVREELAKGAPMTFETLVAEMSAIEDKPENTCSF
jgi:hypothetical protein